MWTDGNELCCAIFWEPRATWCTKTWKARPKGSFWAALGCLNSRERRIIQLRFGLSGGREQTQKEVADELGISCVSPP